MKKSSFLKKMIALSIIPAALAAFSDNTVVVNYIKPANASSMNITVDPLLMTVALQNEISKTGKFQVIERAKIFNTRKLQDLSMDANYTVDDAMLIGHETKSALIVMGRVRYLGDQVWIQLGLFDSEMEQKIEEVTGYYPNSRQGIMGRALPELVKKLVSFEQKPKNNEMPVLVETPLTAQKETMKGKSEAADNRQATIVVKNNPGYYKWAAIGLIAISAVLLVDKATASTEPQAVSHLNAEVVAKW